MLNRQEERKLDVLLGFLTDDTRNKVHYATTYTIEDVAWLATQLFRVNKKFKERFIREASPEEKEIIEKAKIKIMFHYKISEANAHAFLYKTAMDGRRKKIDVAREILQTDKLP